MKYFEEVKRTEVLVNSVYWFLLCSCGETVVPTHRCAAGNKGGKVDSGSLNSVHVYWIQRNTFLGFQLNPNSEMGEVSKWENRTEEHEIIALQGPLRSKTLKKKFFFLRTLLNWTFPCLRPWSNKLLSCLCPLAVYWIPLENFFCLFLVIFWESQCYLSVLAWLFLHQKIVQLFLEQEFSLADRVVDELLAL